VIPDGARHRRLSLAHWRLRSSSGNATKRNWHGTADIAKKADSLEAAAALIAAQ
jgi:hypothetical protein